MEKQLVMNDTSPIALFPSALFGTVLAFLVSHWKGLPFKQRFLIGCALYGIAGVYAFRGGGYWPLIWVIFVVLLVFIPIVYLIGTFFNLWGKK